jgi:hypothetical protein
VGSGRGGDCSDHFDDSFPCIQRLNDFVELRIERQPQCGIADIAYPDPDDFRTACLFAGERDKVFVFG